MGLNEWSFKPTLFNLTPQVNKSRDEAPSRGPFFPSDHHAPDYVLSQFLVTRTEFSCRFCVVHVFVLEIQVGEASAVSSSTWATQGSSTLLGESPARTKTY